MHVYIHVGVVNCLVYVGRYVLQPDEPVLLPPIHFTALSGFVDGAKHLAKAYKALGRPKMINSKTDFVGYFICSKISSHNSECIYAHVCSLALSCLHSISRSRSLVTQTWCSVCFRLAQMPLCALM